MILRGHYYHPDMRCKIDKFRFDFCQHVKIPCKESEHNHTNTPWYKVAVDLIKPWSAKTENFDGEFYALTCIDTTKNLVELTTIDTKSSDAIARKFEQTWLAWYPRQICVIHNNGGKFTWYAFTCLLQLLGIKDLPTTSKNLQSNSICEQMHQTMAVVLKDLTLVSTTSNTTGCCSPWWQWTCNHNTLNALHYLNHLTSKPMGSCLFPIYATWCSLHCRMEALVNNTLIKTNQHCIGYDYFVGKNALKYDQIEKEKLAVKTSVPFPTVHVHISGTITIQLRLGITECINIRCTITLNKSLV